MGLSRQEVGGAAIGDVVYVVGGRAGTTASAAVEAYDTVTDRWRAVAPLPLPLRDVAVAALDGRLYAVGGLQDDGAAVATVFAYDPAADAWTPRAPLPAPRGAAAAAVLDGRLFVTGGLRDGGALRDFAAYDPASDAWSPLPVVPTPRYHLGAAAAGTLLYVVGGREADAALTSVELFQPSAGRWFQQVSPLATARGGLAVAALGGRLFAFGGEGNAADPRGVFPQVERFDPSLNSWFPEPPMPTPRHGAAAVPVGARIYVCGGASQAGIGATGATEVFLPPSSDVAEVRALALTRRRSRLRLALRLLGDPEDPAAGPVRVRVRDGATDLLSIALGTGTLIPNRRATRWRPTSDALPARTRLVLRGRTERVLRLVADTSRRVPAGAALAVDVEIGARRFTGTAGASHR